MDIFKKISDFYGDIMARKDIMARTAKKTTKNKTTKASQSLQPVVANLGSDMLGVYKDACKSEILQVPELNQEQILQISRILDTQEGVFRDRLFTQVTQIFE